MATRIMPRSETPMETLSRVTTDMFDDIRAINEKRFERELTEGVMERMAMGQTSEQISGYISKQMQPPDTFWGRLLAPRRTPDIAKNMMNMMMMYKLREQLKSTETVKPLRDTQMERYNKSMKATIDEVGKARYGYNYTKKDLLGGWENFKASAGYDDLPQNQKGQLWTSWNNNIRRLNQKTNKIRQKLGFGKGEYEWDINDPDVIAASGLEGEMPPGTEEQLEPLLTGDDVPEEYRRLGVTEYRPPTSKVPAGLEDLWDSMSKEEKQTALQHLKAGTATVKQIRDLLK